MLLCLASLHVAVAAVAAAEPAAGAEGRLWARFVSEEVEGEAYLVLAREGLAVRAGRHAAFEVWSGGAEAGVRPRDGERLVLVGPGSALCRIEGHPRRENGGTARVHVGVRILARGHEDDVWQLRPAVGGYALELRLVPFEAWAEGVLTAFEGSGAREDARRALALERAGELQAARSGWMEIALAAEPHAVRAAALERVHDLHGDVAFELSEADRAKLERLRTHEGVRERYGEEGTVLVGERVMGLWPSSTAADPWMRRFLAELDAGYSAMIDFTGQDPCAVYGRRFALFTVPAGAAWFDHHAGLANAPFSSVFFHEMGHDFYKFGGANPAGDWSEGLASFAQLVAMQFLGYHEWLGGIFEEGLAQVEAFRGSGRSWRDAGAYLLGATVFARGGATFDPDARRVHLEVEGFRRVCAAWRELPLEPRSPKDQVRHWVAAQAEVFGQDVLDAYADLGFPVDARDLELARLERERVLPVLARAAEAEAGGRVSEAVRALESLRRAGPRTRMDGEVALRLHELLRSHGGVRERRSLAAELGFLTAWGVSPAQPGLASRGSEPLRERLLAREGSGATWGVGRDGSPELRVPREELRALEGCVEPDPEHERVDLARLLAGAEAPCRAFAVCVLRTAEARRVELRTGQDDDLAVFLDGRELSSNERFGGLVPDDGWVALDLAAGDNVLLLECGNRAGEWGFSARITGPDGLAAPGIEVFAPRWRAAGARDAGR